MPDDTGKVLAFRQRPAPELEKPPARLDWLRDYGPPCNGMTVSLARATNTKMSDGDHFLLHGPDIEPVSLLMPLPEMPDHDREVIGQGLYRVLFYATSPITSGAA